MLGSSPSVRSRSAPGPSRRKERGWSAAPTRSVVSMTRSKSPSGAEVRDRRGTADALNPDVLRPGDVGGDVVGGDDHLGGEGLIDTVAGAVEVGQEHHCVLIGAGRLQG